MLEPTYPNHYRLSELTDKFFRGISREELQDLRTLLLERRYEFISTGKVTALGYDVVNKAINNCDILIQHFPKDAVIYSYRQYEKDNSLNII